MKLIIGLGNPGTKYEKTRHNVGFIFLDWLAKNYKLEWTHSKNLNGWYLWTEFNNEETEFIKPTTFMNNSGLVLMHVIKKHPDLDPKNIIVVHDDIDIELGKYKIQANRGTAGHNGIKSIVEHLGTKNFNRIRIGIKPVDVGSVNIETEKFVLKNFNKANLELLNKKIFPEITEKIFNNS